MWRDPGLSVLLPATVGHSRKTPGPFRLPAAKTLCPPAFVFAARARFRPKRPDTGVVTAPVLSRKGERDLLRRFAPAWRAVALMAAMALVTYFRAVRAGVRAHHAGLPGPDPVPDRAEGPAGDSTTPERELSHV